MPADEFAQFRVFFGRHNKLLQFAKFTLRLAWAKVRFLKIIEFNVPVARVWGKSAKPKGPGLEKYVRQNLLLIESKEFNDFGTYVHRKCHLSRNLSAHKNI